MASREEVILDLLANDRLSDPTEDAAEALDEFEGKQREVIESSDGMNLSLTDIKSGLDLLGQGLEFVGGLYDATVGKVIGYAKEVRDLGRTIGASAEESSKLIQAADDVQVSYETLTRGLETAVRKGFKPNIDNLAMLSDEYLAIQDPIERTEFLMKRFGLSGADMAPLMERGAAGIREMGDAAEEAGLVLAEKTVAAAREAEIAADDLGDTLEGIALRIGAEVLPKVNDLAQGFLNLIDPPTDAAGRIGLLERNLENLGPGMGRARQHMEQQIEVLKAEIVEQERWDAWMKKVEASNYQMSSGIDSATVALLRQEETTRRHEETLALLNDRYAIITASLGGPLKAENEKFAQQQEQAAAKAGELRDRIGELEGLRWLTPAQREELEKLRGQLQENIVMTKQQADEHDLATKRIVFNLLQQRAAQDGLSAAELEVLNQYALKAGIVDQQTALMVTGINRVFDDLNANQNVDAALEKVNAIVDAANRLNGSVTLNFSAPGLDNLALQLERLRGGIIPTAPTGGGNTPLGQARAEGMVPT